MTGAEAYGLVIAGVLCFLLGRRAWVRRYPKAFCDHDYTAIPRTPEEDAEARQLGVADDVANNLCILCEHERPDLTSNIEVRRERKVRVLRALNARTHRLKGPGASGRLSIDTTSGGALSSAEDCERSEGDLE